MTRRVGWEEGVLRDEDGTNWGWLAVVSRRWCSTRFIVSKRKRRLPVWQSTVRN